MFQIDSTLDAIFLGAFFFGLLFAVISLALGVVDFGADHSVDAGDHGHDAGHDYLNFSVILAFIAWFGGVGYLASSGAGWTAAASVAVGVIGGLAGASLMYQVYKRFVRPAGRGELDYERIAAGITEWIRARPDVQLMRYELYLAGARRPEIAARMRESRQLFVRLMIPVAIAAGSTAPERDADLMLTLLNGLIFDELTSREPGHEPTIDPLALRRIIATVAVT